MGWLSSFVIANPNNTRQSSTRTSAITRGAPSAMVALAPLAQIRLTPITPTEGANAVNQNNICAKRFMVVSHFGPGHTYAARTYRSYTCWKTTLAFVLNTSGE